MERVARVYLQRTTDDLHADRDAQLFGAVQVKSVHTSLTSVRSPVHIRTHLIHIRTDYLLVHIRTHFMHIRTDYLLVNIRTHFINVRTDYLLVHIRTGRVLTDSQK